MAPRESSHFSLAILVALLLGGIADQLSAQDERESQPWVGIEGRLLLDPEIPAQQLELLVAEDSDVGMLLFPTWFTKQFPDRRLGRAAEVEGTQPRVIEVGGRLTEVQVTLSKIKQAPPSRSLQK